MRAVSGYVSLLGNSVSNNMLRKYAVIKIGDTLLQNVAIPLVIDSFLSVGKTVTLHLDGSGRAMGIAMEDGSFYCPKPKTGLWVALLIIGFLTFYLIIGLFIMIFAAIRLIHESPMRSLRRQGATPLAQ